MNIRMMIWIAAMICVPAWCSAGDNLFPPDEYLQAKLRQNDIVLLGSTHKKPSILGFVAELIPSLKGLGVTHMGLEISSDHQAATDSYLETGSGLAQIGLHPQLDCPEYRNLFTVIRNAVGPRTIALDMPRSEYQQDISRDQWMARSLLAVLQNEPGAKLLVFIGNLHLLKKLEWEAHVPNPHKSIREYIQQERPSTRMWSVGQLIDENPGECDFTRKFASLPDAVAVDLDDRYRGWKLGLTAPIAILPAECFESVDGLIIY